MRDSWRLLAVAPLVLAGCDPGMVCTAEVNHAIEVHVVDAGTGLPLNGGGSMEYLSGWQESVDDFRQLIPEGGPGVLIGYGRVGVYEVRVEANGYSVWSSEVEVESRGECGGIETVVLEAPLTAESGAP